MPVLNPGSPACQHSRSRKAARLGLMAAVVLLGSDLFAPHAFSAEPSAASRLAAASSTGPLTPEAALAAFQLEPGLSIQLAAAEPIVVDPVALCFDAAGRMFVAENRGYPTGPGQGQPPAGIIAMLEDRDGDGAWEQRTEFASGLTFPNGLMAWRDGLLVTCAPDVLFLRDTNGDGRADVRRVILTGFEDGNTTQLRVSHPTLGLDGWVYLTSGLTGGKVTSPEFPGRPAVDFKSDSRFRPDTWEFEAVDGRGQFGLAFDDFGRRFVCFNRIHIQHAVLPSRYLRRNPDLAFSSTIQNVPEEMVDDLLKGDNPAARLHPISRNVTTADSHAGTFTAACGLLIYRGTALPEMYRGTAFACDPTGNLVHCDRLQPKGAAFTAQPVHPGREFLASVDDWFRPVFLAQGPDGALYVCDMYRKTIEHPQYLPEELRKQTDFDSGKGMGRIYRIAGDKASRKAPDRAGAASPDLPQSERLLAEASTAELCGLLAHPNAWHRETAQRLLIEKKDANAVAILQSQIPNPKFQPPSSSWAALHSLWTLHHLGALDSGMILASLDHENPGVRENALRLAEPRLKDSSIAPSLAARILQMADDADPRVRFQAALTLGELDEERVIGPLVKIVLRGVDDRWLRAAVLSSMDWKRRHGTPRRFLEHLLKSAWPRHEQLAPFLKELGHLLSAAPGGQRLDLMQVMLSANTSAGDVEQAALLTGFGEGLRSRGEGQEPTVFAELFAENAGADSMVRRRFEALRQAAAEVAFEESSAINQRIAAVEFLGYAGPPGAGEALLELLKTTHSADLQRAAVHALVLAASPATIATMLAPERWRQYTPSIREAVLNGVISQPRHLEALLSGLEAGSPPLSAVDSARRNQLLKHRDPQVQRRAEALFKPAEPGDRMKVFESFKPILEWKADARQGRALFKTHCASCHRLDREGAAVGPDLFGMRNQPKEAILLHVLVPEYEIVPGFNGYLIEIKDGRSLSGLIASETENSVTIRAAWGVEETVLKNQILSLTATALSMMPQNLEENMSRQDLADLIAYLKGEDIGKTTDAAN